MASVKRVMTCAAGISAAGFTVSNGAGTVLMASILGVLVMLIVLVALLGVLGRSDKRKTDAREVLRILLSREYVVEPHQDNTDLAGPPSAET
jgi:uncharacterized membrane protein